MLEALPPPNWLSSSPPPTNRRGRRNGTRATLRRGVAVARSPPGPSLLRPCTQALPSPQRHGVVLHHASPNRQRWVTHIHTYALFHAPNKTDVTTPACSGIDVVGADEAAKATRARWAALYPEGGSWPITHNALLHTRVYAWHPNQFIHARMRTRTRNHSLTHSLTHTHARALPTTAIETHDAEPFFGASSTPASTGATPEDDASAYGTIHGFDVVASAERQRTFLWQVLVDRG